MSRASITGKDETGNLCEGFPTPALQCQRLRPRRTGIGNPSQDQPRGFEPQSSHSRRGKLTSTHRPGAAQGHAWRFAELYMVIRAETAQMGEAITQREISHLICPSKSERVVDTLQSRLAEEELRCGVAPLAKTSLQAPHADAEFGGNIGLLHKQPIGLASEPVRRHPADDGPPFRSLFIGELIRRRRTLSPFHRRHWPDCQRRLGSPSSLGHLDKFSLKNRAFMKEQFNAGA